LRCSPVHSVFNLLAEGRTINVVHHDFLSLSASGRTAFVYQQNGAYNVVDVLLITDVEVHASTE
jgi:hypothetical protein